MQHTILIRAYLRVDANADLAGVQDVTVVSEDGSPHGPQRFVLWNPPLTAPNRALAVANGKQMSRTEGRARKGERK